jgi:pilus assembly protein CpaF
MNAENLSLRDRLRSTPINGNAAAVSVRAGSIQNWAYQELKNHIYQVLMDRIDLESLQRLSQDQIRRELQALVERLLEEESAVLNDIERKTLVRDIQNEMLGFGPLEELLADPSVSDILVNSHKQVYVERRGRLELTDVVFFDDAHLLKIIDKIVSRVGRRIDESSPMVDARLPDGSRVNAIIPPLAIDGPCMSIRRFSAVPLKMDDLINHRSLTAEMAEILQGLGKAKINIVISGGTGSGKTTMLNVLSGYISHSERIVTIEDAAELQLQQPHVVRLETRPANIEGKGEVSQRALVKNALRMRPDRIVIGECRGPEALDMLQAMNTGHDGSLTTIHANGPRDALSRIETMVLMSGADLPLRAIREQAVAALDLVVYIERLQDGTRRVTQVSEIRGLEGEVITMQDIFAFHRDGFEGERVIGALRPTGIRPSFNDKLTARGIELPAAWFGYEPEVLRPR